MKNQLRHLKEFQDILDGYRISEDSKKVLEATKLVLLVAPSSSGRNTIINELIKSDEYHYIVSDTTRHKRVNNNVPEKDGVEYWFRTEEEVLADLKKGLFLEAAIIHGQQVSGISIRELEKARDEGKAALADIEIIGMQNIIQAKPDAYAIFVMPPSFGEWMGRLDGRGEMAIEEKRRRLGSAVAELTAAIDNDYYQFVINDNLARAADKIHEIVYENRQPEDQKKGRQLAKELRMATEKWLYQN